MKYKVSYRLGQDTRKHVRYYSALNKTTALEMFNETCSHSLVGEVAQDIVVEKVSVVKSKNT